MAEKINLFELDIDMDKAIADTKRMAEEVELLRAQTQKAKEEQGESSEEYQQYSAALKGAQGDLRTQQKLLQNVSQANNAQTGSIEEMRKQLSVVSVQWAKLSQEERENEDIGGKLAKQKLELTDALKEQEKATGDTRRNVGNYSEGLLDAAENSEVLSGGLKTAITGMKSFTKASLAFIATPVGAVLAVIAGAFLLIKNAMDRSEESTSKIKRGFAAFSGVATALLKFLEPLGEFLIDGLVKGFELVEKGLFSALNAIERGLSFLGLDDAAASMRGFTDSVEENVEASKALTDAELEYAKAQRESRKVQLLYQRDAEKLRQIRDDESKSIQERIKANQELGDLLEEQLNKELELAQKALDVANLRIELEGETTEALDARAAAETEILDIQERITSQESEQLTNRVALEKEASEKILAIREEEAARKAELLKAQTEAAKIELEESMAAIDAELEAERKATEEKLKLSNQIIEQEEARRQREAEAAQMNYENELILLENNEIAKLEKERQFLQLKKEQELEFAETIGADTAIINQKYAEFERQIENEKIQAKLGLQQQFAGNLAQIFGENTKVGKAAAAAETTINAFKAAQGAYAALAPIPIVGPALGIAAGAAALKSGFDNVKKIYAVKSGLPGEGGGGSSGAGGGSSAGGASSVVPSLGQGLASRQSSANQSDAVKDGVSKALKETPLQPTLVQDDVTAAQSNDARRTETATV